MSASTNHYKKTIIFNYKFDELFNNKFALQYL